MTHRNRFGLPINSMGIFTMAMLVITKWYIHFRAWTTRTTRYFDVKINSHSQGFDPYPNMTSGGKGPTGRRQTEVSAVWLNYVELTWKKSTNWLALWSQKSSIFADWFKKANKTLPMELWSLFWRAPPMGNTYFCGMGGLICDIRWYHDINDIHWDPTYS